MSVLSPLPTPPSSPKLPLAMMTMTTNASIPLHIGIAWIHPLMWFVNTMPTLFATWWIIRMVVLWCLWFFLIPLCPWNPSPLCPPNLVFKASPSKSSPELSALPMGTTVITPSPCQLWLHPSPSIPSCPHWMANNSCFIQAGTCRGSSRSKGRWSRGL